MSGIPFDLQLLNACAALLLLVSFAMLSQRRIVTLVNLLALQGALLCIATLLLAWRTGQGHLYFSAFHTFGLKVVLLPWLLHRLIRRLEVYWDTEPLLNVPGTILAKRDVTDIMRTRHRGVEDVTVVTQDSVLATFDDIFNALTAALAGIASVSLVVAGVLIKNIMLVAVSQRTREIGLLKALGASRGEVTRLFLTEAVMLAMLGALAGMVLAYAAIFAMDGMYPDLDFSPPAWAIAGSFLVAVGCGVVFGILPARRAARLDPIAALAGR